MRLGLCIKSFIVCISALSALLALSPCLFAGPAPPVFRVDTSNNRSAYVIGQELGNMILEQEPDFPALVDGLLTVSMKPVADLYTSFYDFSVDAQGLFDDIFTHKTTNDHIPEFVDDMTSGNKISQRYISEAQGIASVMPLTTTDVLGDGLLSENEFTLYQFYHDVLVPVACSGFGIFGDYSSTGNPIVGRNLDLPYVTTDTVKLHAVTIYKGDTRSYANIGLMGMVGTITGMRSDGMFGAAIGSYLLGTPTLETGRYSVLFDLRYALENMDEIGSQEGTEGIHPYTRNHKYYFSHSLLLADSSQVIVQEHPRGKSVNNGEAFPGRLRGWDPDLYPTTVPWIPGKKNMIAVTSRFVLPPGLPYECSLCPQGCYKGEYDLSGVAEYQYYSIDHSCDSLDTTCYSYSEDAPDDCESAEPQTNCWEYCNRDESWGGDYWPGTPDPNDWGENFSWDGYYPIYKTELDSLGAEKWQRFTELGTFAPNTQAHPDRAATVSDVAAIMTDTAGEYDPILAEGTGIFIAVATIQSMVCQPVEGRLYLYTLQSMYGHVENPYLEEIGLFHPLKGDINGTGILELEDAILCLRAVAGASAQHTENNGLSGELDMETALYIMQKKAELRY